jgi:hypothetical protein
MLSDAYDKGQEQRGQVKRDLETGRERGRREAETRTGNHATDPETDQVTAAFRRLR